MIKSDKHRQVLGALTSLVIRRSTKDVHTYFNALQLDTRRFKAAPSAWFFMIFLLNLRSVKYNTMMSRSTAQKYICVSPFRSESHGKRKTAHLICNLLPEPHGEAVALPRSHNTIPFSVKEMARPILHQQQRLKA